MRYLTLILLAMSLTITGTANALNDDDDSAITVIEGPVAPATVDSTVIGVPETDEAAGALFAQLMKAAKTDQWSVFTGFLILLIVFGANRLGLAKVIGNRWVPWFTLGVGASTAIAIGLAAGIPVVPSIRYGLIEGGIAITLWELVVKNYTKKKSDGTVRA